MVAVIPMHMHAESIKPGVKITPEDVEDWLRRSNAAMRAGSGREYWSI